MSLSTLKRNFIVQPGLPEGQAMAGTFALGTAISLDRGWDSTALFLEGLLVAALLALTLGGFCVGSFIYHLLHGHVDRLHLEAP